MRQLTLLTLLLLTPLHAQEAPTAQDLRALRIAKAALVWRASAPWSFSPALAERLCSEHERYGIAADWWYSLANARYASGLNPRMSYRAGGMWARGLMDCTQRNAPPSAFADLGSADLFNPHVSIRNHCIEAGQYHQRTGRQGWALQRMVFLPSRPDCQRAWAEERKWRRVECTHLRILAQGYATGKLGDNP
jgi:hypothetical protein